MKSARVTIPINLCSAITGALLILSLANNLAAYFTSKFGFRETRGLVIISDTALKSEDELTFNILSHNLKKTRLLYKYYIFPNFELLKDYLLKLCQQNLKVEKTH